MTASGLVHWPRTDSQRTACGSSARLSLRTKRFGARNGALAHRGIADQANGRASTVPFRSMQPTLLPIDAPARYPKPAIDLRDSTLLGRSIPLEAVGRDDVALRRCLGLERCMRSIGVAALGWEFLRPFVRTRGSPASAACGSGAFATVSHAQNRRNAMTHTCSPSPARPNGVAVGKALLAA